MFNGKGITGRVEIGQLSLCGAALLLCMRLNLALLQCCE